MNAKLFLQDLNTPTYYALCQVLDLAEGILVSHDFSTPVEYISQGSYQQNCYEGMIPMLNTHVDLILNEFSEPLPIVRECWEAFTQNPGSFINGVVPVLYSISFLAVVTWFLTVFVITNFRKSSILLQVSTTFALIYMIMTVVKSLVLLHEQQKDGYFDGQSLISAMNQTTWIGAVDLVVILLLQINQVQVIMRLFNRQNDKRIIFLAGVSASIISQVLWAVVRFHPFSELAEVGRVIPSLTYLVRIATNVIYATIFTAFLLTRLRTLIAHKSIWLITVLSFIFIYAPVAFFVADVTSPWAHEFSVVTYVVCVVLPWEWCNSYQTIQRIQEKEGILGRKFYEDELCELDRLGLFVEEEDEDVEEEDQEEEDNDSGNDGESENRHIYNIDGSIEIDDESLSTQKQSSARSEQLSTEEQVNSVQPSSSASFEKGNDAHHTTSHIAFASLTHKKSKVRDSSGRAKSKIQGSYSRFKNQFLNATDKAIAIGLEISRPSSKASISRLTPNYITESESIFDVNYHRSSFFARNNRQRESNISTLNQTRPNRDVYVYSTKNVKLNSGD